MNSRSAPNVKRSAPSATTLFDAFEDHDFSLTTCFLCGKRLDAKTRSDEHVFAQWMLRRFDLHNARLVLLNGTSIPYRQLTIPCCTRCNNEHLSKIEGRVREVIEGARPIESLDEKTLYLWSSKIFYGLLYREVLLPMERSLHGNSASIVSIDEIQRYKILHVFLQAARLPVRFDSFDSKFPASVFAFKTQQPRTLRAQFEFRDDIRHATLYLRLGEVEVLAAFDAGAQAFEWQRLYRKYQRFRLHPIQLEELAAAMFYKASLFDRTPKLMISGDARRGYRVFIMPIAGLSTKPVFKPWDRNAFAEYLSTFTGLPAELLAPDGAAGGVLTYMTRPDSNRFNRMDIRKFPWRGVP